MLTAHSGEYGGRGKLEAAVNGRETRVSMLGTLAGHLVSAVVDLFPMGLSCGFTTGLMALLRRRL